MADLFRAAGCDVRVRVDVPGARHKENVDVLVTFSPMGIADLWAVECKDQVAKVSRGDVQTFHNKVENIGASRGVMVARNGYQAGCQATVKHTNIVLADMADLAQQLKDAMCDRRLEAAHQRINAIVHRLHGMEKRGTRVPGKPFRCGVVLRLPTGPRSAEYFARRGKLGYLKDQIAEVRLGSRRYCVPNDDEPDDEAPDDYVPVDVLGTKSEFCDAVERVITDNERWADGLTPPD